jgi:hypothetical protein
VGKIVDV